MPPTVARVLQSVSPSGVDWDSLTIEEWMRLDRAIQANTPDQVRARFEAEHVEQRQALHLALVADIDPDPETEAALLRRIDARKAGADPDTGERLDADNPLQKRDRAVLGREPNTDNCAKPETKRCHRSLKFRRVADGIEGVRWTRCGHRSCDSCGPEVVIPKYEMEAAASFPDVDQVRRIVCSEALWTSSIRSKISRAREARGGGYHSTPMVGDQRLIFTDAEIAEGEIVDVEDALIEVGEALDALHSEAEELKGRHVRPGGDWTERRNAYRERQEALKAEQQEGEMEVEYLGICTAAPTPEHVRVVAESLGAKAVAVAHRDAEVEDHEGQLIVGTVCVTGLTILTAQVFWKRLGFRSWKQLAEARCEAELRRTLHAGWKAVSAELAAA